MHSYSSGLERTTRTFILGVLLLVATRSLASADPTPSPNTSTIPAPSATPSAAIPSGWHNSVDGFMSFVDQATQGTGTQPLEGPRFAAGSVLSPMTPYDTFSSAPTTPGVAGIGQLTLRTSYSGRHIDASIESSLGSVTGSVTNAAYWTESLLPLLNPHLGSKALPYSIAFPTHAGQDDGTAAGVSILAASVGAADNTWTLRGGWLDLNQTERFVFVQPVLTNQIPEVGLATAESLGNGSPALDAWPSPPPGLPLHGVDLMVHERSATAELTNATLPSLPGTSARISNASVVLDRGEGTQFAVQILHLVTGGAIISTTTLFGADATVLYGPQGPLPLSNLGGQTSTVGGLHAAFHVARKLDGTFDYGRSWYDADHVLRPGTARAGNYYHFALTHPLGDASLGVDAYRFEPRYATAILPYGAAENVWSVAWSWPGVWLKSNYQLADNTQVGANRQGYRLRYARSGGSLELRASFAELQQIDPSSIPLANQVGFVEGFFLPQTPAVTLGREKQIAAWLEWHPPFADVSFDFVDDMMHRDAPPTQPEDAVSYEAPQTVLMFSRSLNKKVLVAVGAGSYAMVGSWAHGPLTNVNFRQNVVFAGGQYAESQHAIVLVQVRHSTFSGLPSIINGPSPDFSGSLLVLEQRFHY